MKQAMQYLALFAFAGICAACSQHLQRSETDWSHMNYSALTCPEGSTKPGCGVREKDIDAIGKGGKGR